MLSSGKKLSSTPFSGRAMTWALTSSPTCLATCRSRVDRRADRADISADDGRDVGAADLNLTDERDVGRLEHGIGRLDLGDEPFGFNQSDGFVHSVSCRF